MLATSMSVAMATDGGTPQTEHEHRCEERTTPGRGHPDQDAHDQADERLNHAILAERACADQRS